MDPYLRVRARIHTHPHTFFSSPGHFLWSPVPAAQAPGHRVTPTPCSSTCLTSGPREGNCSHFWFAGHVLGLCGCHALCSLVWRRQAALIPFSKEWRKGISDWATSSFDQAFDIIVTGGQSWMAS